MPPYRKLMYPVALFTVLGVASGACSSSVSPFGPSIEVSLTVHQAAAMSSTLLVSVGNSDVSLRAPDTQSEPIRTQLHVRGYGDMPVHVTLLGSRSDTLAAVAFTQSLRADYQYGLGAVVSRVRPFGTCLGTVTATPLRNSPSDTLFVVYVGMPKGAIC